VSASAHRWVPVRAGEHGFLNPVFRALGVECVQALVDARGGGSGFDRLACGGHLHLLARPGGRPVAVAWSDFRVRSATFDHAVSRRFSAFIHEAGERGLPMIYVVNSAGISLGAGRRVFSDAFRLWPELLRFTEHQTLLTCAVGRCLGLAPLLYGLGHYRMAVAGRTQINLTGPQVLAMCFGPEHDFDRDAAVERFVRHTDLVHEIVPTVDEAIARFLTLLSGDRPAAATPCNGHADATLAFLEGWLDARPLELVPGWSGGVRLFLGEFRGRRVGIFINPVPRHAHLIDNRCLDKYGAGLDLFARLGVPILSFLDAPGIDPRFAESDDNNIRRMLAVGERIIRYPHGSLGVIWGRCFGGATTLVFPKVFGGARVIALRGARIGSMQEQFVQRLLENDPRLLTQWRASLERQRPDLEDLIEEGSLDAVVDLHELPVEIEAFLAAHPTRTMRPTSFDTDDVAVVPEALRLRARLGP